MRWSFVILLLVLFISCSWTRIDELSVGEKRTAKIYQTNRSVDSPHLSILNSGDLAMVFHVSSDSIENLDAICLTVSSDNGNTWSQPDTVVRVDAKIQKPHLAQFPDGLITVSFCKYRRIPKMDSSQPIGCFIMKSYDNGKSFTAPAMISIPEYEMILYADAISSTSDGSWLLPMLGRSVSQQTHAIAAFSHDGGIHWDEIAIIAEDTSSSIQDLTIAQTSKNNWLCLFTNIHGKIYQAFSADNGRSWSSPVWSHIYGQDPDLGITKIGTVLCIFKDNTPQGISAIRSYDFGRSWEDEMNLSASHRYSQNPSVFISSERVMTVYCSEQKPNKQFNAINLTYFDQRQPDAPRGFTGSVSDRNVNLRWNPVKEAHYYLVYRSAAFQDSSQIGMIKIDNLLGATEQTVFEDVNLNSGFMYQYQISAAFGEGELFPESGNEGQKVEPITITVQ